MARDRDDESGRYTEQYPDEAFFAAVDTTDFATTREVAVDVGCSYDLAYRRLNQLHEQGKVERSKVGSSLVWSQ